MLRLLSSILLLLFVFGCASTPEVKVIRKEVPKPYWNPPKNIKPAPEPKPLETPRLPDDAETKQIHIALGSDYVTLIEENDILRWLYKALVITCSAPEPAPPPN